MFCKLYMSDNVNKSHEPLLEEVDNRYTLLPIKYPNVFEHYKKQLAVFWTVEEVSLDRDLGHWEKLSDDEKHFIKHILAFFAGSDGIVQENLAERFMQDIQIPEVRLNYGFQIMIEGIHSEMYSLLIDTYISDVEEKAKLFNAINTIPCIAKKANWAIKWITSKEANFATRLVAFACVEGVFFSGSFAAIFWLKKRGLMPGLTVSNEFISRDEGLHTDFACMLYNMLVNRLSQETIHALFTEAVEVECEFMTDALPVRLIGMNADSMVQYIKFVADRLIRQLGYQKLYNVSNPFDFMEHISVENKTNFFERRVVDYQKFNVGSKKEDVMVRFDAEF